MAFLDDISAYLIAKGIGSASTVFLSMLPEAPDVAIALFEYSGKAPDYGGRGQSYMEHPRMQVLVRGTDYPTARATLQSIYNLLDDVTMQTLGTTFYYQMRALASPAGLPRDENLRYLISCNFEASKVVT